MSSRPMARGRDAGVVTGGGAGTSRLQRVLAVGTVGCFREHTTCFDNAGDINGKLGNLTFVFLKLGMCDLMEESDTKEEMRGQAWEQVEKAMNAFLTYVVDGCVPYCVKNVVRNACARANVDEHYATHALAYLKTQAGERAASSHEQTVGRVLASEPTSSAVTLATHSFRRLSLENDMPVGGDSEPKRTRRENPINEARKQAKKECPEFNKYGLREGESGVTVIPFMDKATLEGEREKLRAYFDSMHEYKNGEIYDVKQGGQMPHPYANGEKQCEPDPETFANGSKLSLSTLNNDGFAPVEGGFAGMGNPSSYHNKFVRDLRMAAHVAVVESGVIPVKGDENLEQEACRLMVRRSYKTPTAETWHRDEAIFAKDGDTIYGGWVNLDLERDQLFSMVPYTAYDEGVKNMNNGFNKISVSEHLGLVQRSVEVRVPPGHILIFNERTIHEVSSVSLKKCDVDGLSGSQVARCRLFMGWRTTNDTEPITPNLDARLDAQEALPLKSGQHKHPNPPEGFGEDDFQKLYPGKVYPGPPPMYSKLHLTNNPILLKKLASHLKPACTEIITYRGSGKQAQRYPNGLRAPILYMPSLYELNKKDPTITMYAAYTEAERSILKPGREWRNLRRIDGTIMPLLKLDSDSKG